MSTGAQAFRLTEVKRAYRALRDLGVKVSRVVLDGSRVEFITADDPSAQRISCTTAEDARNAL